MIKQGNTNHYAIRPVIRTLDFPEPPDSGNSSDANYRYMNGRGSSCFVSKNEVTKKMENSKKKTEKQNRKTGGKTSHGNWIQIYNKAPKPHQKAQRAFSQS